MKVWKLELVVPEESRRYSCGVYHELKTAKKEADAEVDDAKVVWRKINNNNWHGNLIYEGEDDDYTDNWREYFEAEKIEVK